MINNKDPQNRIENDQTRGAKYPNKEEGETNKTSAISNFMPQTLPDNEISERINSLNSRPREVFNAVDRWFKDNVKHDCKESSL